MTAYAIPCSTHVAGLLRSHARATSVRTQALSSRRNGKFTNKPRPTTQLAAIQVLDPEEELDAVSSADTDLDFDDSGPPGLSTQQVQTLLSVVCNETDLAEIELKIGSFDLKVRRSMAADAVQASQAAVSPAFAPYAGSPFASTASIDEGLFSGSVDQTATASTDSDDEDEETTVFVEAHKVGIMRRGRYVKGKKVGKGPIAEKGTTVKKGQIIGFIEQLGTFVPVEAQQAGEIVAFTTDEGQSVQYKQELVEVAPFFGGHIIGDKKHA